MLVMYYVSIIQLCSTWLYTRPYLQALVIRRCHKKIIVTPSWSPHIANHAIMCPTLMNHTFRRDAPDKHRAIPFIIRHNIAFTWVPQHSRLTVWSCLMTVKTTKYDIRMCLQSQSQLRVCVNRKTSHCITLSCMNNYLYHDYLEHDVPIVIRRGKQEFSRGGTPQVHNCVWYMLNTVNVHVQSMNDRSLWAIRDGSIYVINHFCILTRTTI